VAILDAEGRRILRAERSLILRSAGARHVEAEPCSYHEPSRTPMAKASPNGRRRVSSKNHITNAHRITPSPAGKRAGNSIPLLSLSSAPGLN